VLLTFTSVSALLELERVLLLRTVSIPGARSASTARMSSWVTGEYLKYSNCSNHIFESRSGI
jgi:hypothetical protein